MAKKLTHKQIIEKLKSDEHYYGEFGKKYIFFLNEMLYKL